MKPKFSIGDEVYKTNTILYGNIIGSYEDASDGEETVIVYIVQMINGSKFMVTENETRKCAVTKLPPPLVASKY